MIKMPIIETNELIEIIKNDKKMKSQAELRDFDDAWLTVFIWLLYDKATQLRTCEICTFTKGCSKEAYWCS